MTSLQQLSETIQARIECRTMFITVVLCDLALLASYVLRRWRKASATTYDGGVGSRECSAPRASASTTANNAGSVPDESTPLNDPADQQPAREAPFDARRHTNPRNRDGNDTRLTPPFVPPSPSTVHRGGLGSGAENTAASEVPGIDNITDPAEDARDLAARRILRGHQQRRSTANRGPRPAASPWRAVASSASGGRSRTGMGAPATSSAFSPCPRPATPKEERSVHAQQASEENVRRVSVMVDEAAATSGVADTAVTTAVQGRRRGASGAAPAPSTGFASAMSTTANSTPVRPPRAPAWWPPPPSNSAAASTAAAATVAVSTPPPVATATWEGAQRTTGRTAASSARSTERRSAISFSVGVTPVQPPGVALPWPTFSSTGAPPAAAAATTTTLSFAAAGAAAAATTTTTSSTWKRTKTATGVTAAAPAPSPFSTATTRPFQPPQPAWPWPAIPHTGAPGNTVAAAAAATAGTSTTIAAAATWNGTQRMTGPTAVAPAPSTRKRSASFVTATVAPVQPPGAASPWPTFSSAAASVATAAAATSTTTNAPVMWKRAKGATGVTAVAPAPSKRNISAISVIATVTPVQPPGAALPRPTFSSTGAPPAAAAAATTTTINAPATWKRAKTAAGVTAVGPGISKRNISAISVTATVTPVQPPGAALPWPTFSSTGVPPAAVATTTTINAPATWKRAKTAAGVTAVAPAPSKRNNSAISVNATVAPVQPPGAALPWPTFSSTGAPPAAAVATTTTTNAPATSKRTRGATGALAATAAPRTATGLGLSFAPTATPTQPPRAAWPVPAYTPTGGVATIATTTPAAAATLTATAAPSIGTGSSHSYTTTAPLLHLHQSRMPDTSTSTSNGSTAPSKQIGKATEANIVHCCAADDGKEEGWVRAPYLDHEDGKEVAGAFVYLPVTVLRPACEEGCKCAGGDHAVWVRPGCAETFEWAFEDAGVIWEVPSSAILHKENAAVVGSEKVPECIGKTCDRCPCDRSECSWTPDGLELLCNYCADAPRRDVCNYAELRGYGRFRCASACDCKGW